MEKIKSISRASVLVSLSWTAAVAQPASQPPPTPMDIPEVENIKDPELRQLLATYRKDVEGKRQAWLAAKVAVDTASKTIADSEERKKRDKAIRDRLKGLAVDGVEADEDAAIAAQKAKIPDLLKTESETRQKYLAARSRFAEYIRVAADLPEPDQPVRFAGRTTTPNEHVCSIDSELDRLQLVPNACTITAQAESETIDDADGLSQGYINFEDRAVDRRGVTAQLSAGSDSTTATLKLSDSFNRRLVPVGTAPFRQRVWNWAYNIGLQSTIDKKKRARIGGFAEGDDDRRVGDLDRLDQGLKLIGGISRNYFRGESEKSFQQRATRMADEARAACRADQTASKPVLPSTCEGPDLLRWIFAQKSDGNHANQTHVDAFNDVYWGTAQKAAQFGFGLKFDLARPEFAYYPFSTMEVDDPLRPGKKKTVIDTRTIPAGFYEEEPTKERHLAWTLGLYGYYHFPYFPRLAALSHLGTTVIPSITYKREYEAPADVLICPEDSPLPFVTTELCRTVKVADGTRTKGWVYGLEIRNLFGGGRILGGRGLIPAFAVAPKWTFESSTKRHAFDVPLWFTFDDKGKLNGGLRFAYETGGENALGGPRKDDTGLYIQFGTTFDLQGSN